MANKQKKTEDTNPKTKRKFDSRGIMGVAMLLVVISIAYTSATVILGTDGLLPKLLTAPQVVFALTLAIKQFTK